MANIEDRLKNLEKRLNYHKVVVGILAFCLMLAVATHLDAEPRGRNQDVSQPLDSRHLSPILARIEQRLTSLEKQSVSHQPSTPAMHQPGSSFGQISVKIRAIEQQLKSLENQVSQARGTRTSPPSVGTANSQPPAVPTSNQAASSPDLTTIMARVTVLEQKVSQQTATPAANQMSSNPDLSTIEARLTALENQAGSPQSATPAANQASPTPDLATVGEVVDGIEARVTVLEQAASQQSAAPSTSQTNATSGVFTCTELRVVDSNGFPYVRLMAKHLESGVTHGSIQLDSSPNDSGYNILATISGNQNGGYVRTYDFNGNMQTHQ